MLVEKGFNVVGFDSLNDYYDPKIKIDRITNLRKNNNYFFVMGNVCNTIELDNLFSKHEFSLVIHLAAQAGVRQSINFPQLYFENNMHGFFNVLEACRIYKVKKLVFASSSSVYGNRSVGPFFELDSSDFPESFYAATKKANEVMAYSYSRQYGIQCIGLRFFSVYGPWGRPDMAYFSFTQKIFNEEVITLFSNGEMLRDFTYIKDIVDGVSNLVTDINLLPQYKIINFGNGNPLRTWELINVLEETIGKKALVCHTSGYHGDVLLTFANISEASKCCNYLPKTDLKEGLFTFVNWYKNYFQVNG